ncbi:unnamed protein product [Clonostachys rosea f. rosea IK726]|uniref:FAD/NAD(P)-binding domain-containing protein n=2 Tax=Bionectria ochroleuca TaxID=29856 RepID=A0A0B7KD83_BIOOC|nr:unnamed protein product [Clonostachys rosea f. rosea IK726]
MSSPYGPDFPEDNRVETGSVNIAAASFPAIFDTSSVNSDEAAISIVDKLNRAVNEKHTESLANLFLDSSYWRDHLCLSWDYRTINGGANISRFVADSDWRISHVEIDRSRPHRAPQLASMDVDKTVKVVRFFVTVATKLGRGQGVFRLTRVDGQWKILTLYTVLQELKGLEEPRGSRRPHGKEYDGLGGNPTWKENRQREENVAKEGSAVLIIGAGQAGLTAAARLKMLKVETLVIDREDRVGDNWRNRYRRLILHDPVWSDHLPYLHFPDHWPVYTPKDKLGDFFESYASLLELNVWTKTELVSSSWDEEKRHWTVTVERQVGDKKETRTFHPRHVIQATGHSGKKNIPVIKGMDTFKGLLCHSAEFPGAKPESKGKRAVVVGSCNSGHDIAQDYYENGYEVTMLQRSSTCVISSYSSATIALGELYSENSPPVDDADVLNLSLPGPLSKRAQIDTALAQHNEDNELLEGLQKAGFKVDKGPDFGGLIAKYYQRGGGYYIDVGASQLIIDGKIKIKHGQEVDEVTEDGLRLSDGTVLPADEVVFATGYQNMRTQSRVIFGDEVADRLQDVWGLDHEGEFRTMWRPSGHPGFWFMGGNLLLCRYFSALLALQIKAREVGLV